MARGSTPRHSTVGAALDVFDHESLQRDHSLRSLENVILTPHVGYVIAASSLQEPPRSAADAGTK